MNRREALAALVALPEVTRITTTTVQPRDVIVIECEQKMSLESADRIKATLEQVWPGRKCLVLAGGMKLKVVGK